MIANTSYTYNIIYFINVKRKKIIIKLLNIKYVKYNAYEKNKEIVLIINSVYIFKKFY